MSIIYKGITVDAVTQEDLNNLVIQGVYKKKYGHWIKMDSIYKKTNNAWSNYEIEAIVEPVDLIVGTVYSIGNYSFMCAEEITEGSYIMQSQGMTGGNWPGYSMSDFGNGSTYLSDINDIDIHEYNADTQAFYTAYSSIFKGDKGLYLVSNTKVNQTSSGSAGSGYYYTALLQAATDYESFNNSPSNAVWLGTVNATDSKAWYINISGNVMDTGGQSKKYVIAPAFNIDTRKILLSGTTITPRT